MRAGGDRRQRPRDKHFPGIEDGVRESTQSWREVLVGMKQRGFTRPAKLAVGDGALGFWSALSEVCPETRSQRCWLHKTGNVLNYLPKSGQPKAKQGLQEIWMAETRAQAERAFDDWIERYEDKYPKATACLARDREQQLAFLRLPRRPLDASAHDQRDRAGRRHHPPSELADEGLRHPPHHVVDDLQDGHERREVLATTTRLPPARQGYRGHQVQRRYRGHRGQQGRRMTNPPYTRFDTSSLPHGLPASIGALLLAGLAPFVEGPVGSAAHGAGAQSSQEVSEDDLRPLLWLLRRRSLELPGAPPPPTVEAVTATELTVVWTAPGEATEIVDYDVQYRQGDEGTYLLWDHHGTEPQTTITGLAPERVYMVRVRAVNDFDAGDWSDPARGTTAAPGPVFAEGDSARREIPENAAPGTPVGTPVTAIGATNYHLEGADAEDFAINAASGQIRARGQCLLRLRGAP